MSTLPVSPLPRGSEDSEQDNFPFTSGLPFAQLLGQGLPAGGEGSVWQPGLSLPGVWDLSGENSDKPGAAWTRPGTGVGGSRQGGPVRPGFWSRKWVSCLSFP